MWSDRRVETPETPDRQEHRAPRCRAPSTKPAHGPLERRPSTTWCGSTRRSSAPTSTCRRSLSDRGRSTPRCVSSAAITMDGAATHLFVPGLRRHIAKGGRTGRDRRRDHGGARTDGDAGDPRRQRRRPDPARGAGRDRPTRRSPRPRPNASSKLKAEFEANRGYWSPIWDGVSSSRPTSSRPIPRSRPCHGSTVCSNPRWRSSSIPRSTWRRRTSCCRVSSSTCATHSGTAPHRSRSWR